MTDIIPRSLSLTLLRFLCKLPTPQAILQLNESISNELPKDLEEIPIAESFDVPEEIDKSKILHFNYDEAHSGRFSVFGTNGATIDSDYVLNRVKPLDFVLNNLSTGENSWNNGCTVFVNGMRTASQPGKVPGIMSSKRVEFYAAALKMRLAHVHIATKLDQPPGKISPDNTHFLKLITKIFQIAGLDHVISDEEGNIQVPQTILDVLQATLSVFGFLDNPIKKTLRKLIELADKENPLTLLVYSRGSIECNAALREFLKSSNDIVAAAKKLREGLTILTIACSATNWPDGPAYVHLSSWDDPMAQVFCNANQNSGAGADAVFLHNETPYPGTIESHNFQGGTLQFLTVLMLYNKVRSIRELWELGNDHSGISQYENPYLISSFPKFLFYRARSLFGIKPSDVGGGKIKIPTNINDLVDAMISVTDGTEYLWDKDEAMKICRPIPSKDEAVEMLSRELKAKEEIERIRRWFESYDGNENTLTIQDSTTRAN